MKIIGRTDFFNFPDLGINFVEVKIDTGAFSSALHCESAEVVDDILVVDFGDGNIKRFEEYGKKIITSSNGTSQERFSIITTVELFGEVEYIEITLANRSRMKSKCLIGRTFLSPNKILVYVKERNLSIKSCEPFFFGVEDFNLYLKGKALAQFQNIEDLFLEIEKKIYTAKMKKITDFRKTTNMKRLEKYHFVNGSTKVTLDKLVSFVYEDKKKKRFFLDGQDRFLELEDYED